MNSLNTSEVATIQKSYLWLLSDLLKSSFQSDGGRKWESGILREQQARWRTDGGGAQGRKPELGRIDPEREGTQRSTFRLLKSHSKVWVGIIFMLQNKNSPIISSNVLQPKSQQQAEPAFTALLSYLHQPKSISCISPAIPENSSSMTLREMTATMCEGSTENHFPASWMLAL